MVSTTSAERPRLAKVVSRVSTGCCGIAAVYMLSKDSHIDAGVEDEHEDADGDLEPPRQAGGGKWRREAKPPRPAPGTGPPRPLQEDVLPRGERTIPAEPLDQYTPHRRREVNPHQSRPPQHQKSSEDDEEDEEEVR